MSRRTLLIVVIVLVLVGAAVGAYLLLSSRSTNIIGLQDNSAQGTAKSFISELTGNKLDAVYERLSDTLKEGYSADYWKKDFFTKFVDYKEQPQLLETTELTKAGSTEALHYPPETSVWRFLYQFRLNNLNYQLTIETSKPNDSDTWKISKLEGKYNKE